ncbi:MAG: response regulator [Candidatus Omnitrophica bacterium]|nr:response regulator [Candidatus Omnitrophota bacterium]
MEEGSYIKILVVDDDEQILSYLKKVLQLASYEVILATNGKQALRLAKEHIPNLIILDINLPDVRGEEIKRLLSQDNLTSQIPIIYLTGIISKEEAQVIQRFTKQALVLAKPVVRSELITAINQLLI